MPAITRRQCTCACPVGYVPPDGEGLPTCSCSACPNSPCSYFIDFGCHVVCDGLSGGPVDDGEGLLSGKKISPVFRGECLFEDHCVYRTMRLIDPPCTPPLPVAGNPENSCGEGNKYGVDCGCDSNQCDSWLDCVQGPPTWRLEYTSTSAELVGTTNSDETVTYRTRSDDPWVCPEPGVESVNRLWMVDYPDAMTDCDKFPKMVCVYPGTYEFQTYCIDKEDVCTCCDAGWEKVAVTMDAPDCEFNGRCVTLTRNATLPGFISDPGGACGYLYGTFLAGTTCGASDVTMHYLTWCDGTNWKVRLYCGETMVCDETATMTECCPEGAVTSFTCADFGVCCPDCPDIDICGCTYPRVVYLTITSTCGTINGQVVTLTYDGPVAPGFRWKGTFDGGSCGTLYVTMGIFDSDPGPGVTCSAALDIGTIEYGTNCLQANASGLTCPLGTLTFIGPGWLAACACCPAHVPTTVVTV